MLSKALAATIVIFIGACGQDGPADAGPAQNSEQTAVVSESRDADLLFLVEEEKMAHDLYTDFYDAWGQQRFANIASSESQHINAVLGLLHRYNLTPPATLSEHGVFQNEKIKQMYIDLKTRGLQSRADAIAVGVIVEETDIQDLQEMLARSPVDMQAVLTNLLEASKRHLAAFSRG